VDLVVVDRGESAIASLISDGAGSFNTTTSQMPSPPVAADLADLNGDNYPDLVVLIGTGTVVQSHLGAGDGSFSASAMANVSDSNATAVALADLNDDMTIDAVVTHGAGSEVEVFLGTGTGGFQAPSTITTANSAAIVTGNFDTAQLTDFAIINGGTNHVTVFENHGGVFNPRDAATAGGPLAIAAANIDGDLVDDLVTADFGASAISVMRGTSGMIGGNVEHDTATGPVAVVLVDIDRDGKIDAITANKPDGSVSILFGDGHGGFAPHVDIPAGNPGIDALAVASFTDGPMLDIAVANSDDHTVALLTCR
jgi:hypothetical protein